MNTKTQDIIDIEKQISDSKPALERFAALERLRDNKDFQYLIENFYLKEEAVRLVHLKATSQSDSPDAQSKIIRDLDAIGNLYMFFVTISQEGKRAKYSKDQAEQLLTEILDEQGE